MRRKDLGAAMLDVALVHAPSVYDFRNRDDILFAYLGNSDSVHVSPIFEMPPLGIIAIEQYLISKGKKTVFFNIASHMLRQNDFDVEDFLRKLDAKLLGIDLHWLAHAQGALELAEIYKRFHPDAKVFLGGISASYFHKEVIQYPQIDYILRGVDTLASVELLSNSDDQVEQLRNIPNLTWKQAGRVIINEIRLDSGSYSVTIDWKRLFEGKTDRMTPYNMVIPQYGCEYDCRWCGGSRYANRRQLQLDRVVHKSPELLKKELQSIVDSGSRHHTVTMINYWHEYDELLDSVHDVFCSDAIDKVHISVRRLPDPARFAGLDWAKKLVIELSPDSQDIQAGRNCGHGHYTMDEMEEFIHALTGVVYSFEIYFIIGIPNQTMEDVRETVRFCGQLLDKYRGKRVIPYICPMLPFLDPGSVFSDNAEKYGYRVLFNRFEDYRKALLSMNWRDRLNYETKWMTRNELVDITYESIRELTLLKAKYGIMPRGVCDGIVSLIDRTREILARMDRCEAMPESKEKTEERAVMKKIVLEYNEDQFARVRSQQRPVDLGFSRLQWFDTEESFQMFSGRINAMNEPMLLVDRKSDQMFLSIGDMFGLKAGEPAVIAGPCSIENMEYMEMIAVALVRYGVKFIRGGAYKPRSSPYAFQGLREEGLKILGEIGKKYGLISVTEVVDTRDVELVGSYADILQIGSRNMQNYELLKQAGRFGKPVLLKRGMCASTEEFKYAAEYIAAEGNRRIILCERGIRSFDGKTRNMLDICSIPIIKNETSLPIIADLSHSLGRKDIMPTIARSVLAAGADGIMVEVHPRPELALSDAAQQLTIEEFTSLLALIDVKKEGYDAEYNACTD